MDLSPNVALLESTEDVEPGSPEEEAINKQFVAHISVTPNVLCWWRFRAKTKYHPGRSVSLDEELNAGFITKDLYSQLINSRASQQGYIIVQNLDDLTYSVCNSKTCDPLPFPAKNRQIRLERQLSKSLSAYRALLRARHILNIQRNEADKPPREMKETLRKFLEIIILENCESTEAICCHLFKTPTHAILKAKTSLPQNFDFQAMSQRREEPPQPRMYKQSQQIFNRRPPRPPSLHPPQRLFKVKEKKEIVYADVPPLLQKMRSGKGLVGLWFQQFKEILLTRSQLLRLMQPIPLDLLWNPTLLYLPLPLELPEILLAQIRFFHSKFHSYHLKCATLYAHLLFSSVCVRSLESEKKSKLSKCIPNFAYPDFSLMGKNAKNSTGSSVESKWRQLQYITGGKKPHINRYSIALSLGYMYGQAYEIENLRHSFWIGLGQSHIASLRSFPKTEELEDSQEIGVRTLDETASGGFSQHQQYTARLNMKREGESIEGKKKDLSPMKSSVALENMISHLIAKSANTKDGASRMREKDERASYTLHSHPTKDYEEASLFSARNHSDSQAEGVCAAKEGVEGVAEGVREREIPSLSNELGSSFSHSTKCLAQPSPSSFSSLVVFDGEKQLFLPPLSSSTPSQEAVFSCAPMKASPGQHITATDNGIEMVPPLASTDLQAIPPFSLLKSSPPFSGGLLADEGLRSASSQRGGSVFAGKQLFSPLKAAPDDVFDDFKLFKQAEGGGLKEEGKDGDDFLHPGDATVEDSPHLIAQNTPAGSLGATSKMKRRMIRHVNDDIVKQEGVLLEEDSSMNKKRRKQRSFRGRDEAALYSLRERSALDSINRGSKLEVAEAGSSNIDEVSGVALCGDEDAASEGILSMPSYAGQEMLSNKRPKRRLLKSAGRSQKRGLLGAHTRTDTQAFSSTSSRKSRDFSHTPEDEKLREYFSHEEEINEDGSSSVNASYCSRPSDYDPSGGKERSRLEPVTTHELPSSKQAGSSSLPLWRGKPRGGEGSENPQDASYNDENLGSSLSRSESSVDTPRDYDESFELQESKIKRKASNLNMQRRRAAQTHLRRKLGRGRRHLHAQGVRCGVNQANCLEDRSTKKGFFEISTLGVSEGNHSKKLGFLRGSFAVVRRGRHTRGLANARAGVCKGRKAKYLSERGNFETSLHLNDGFEQEYHDLECNNVEGEVKTPPRKRLSADNLPVARSGEDVGSVCASSSANAEYSAYSLGKRSRGSKKSRAYPFSAIRTPSSSVSSLYLQKKVIPSPQRDSNGRFARNIKKTMKEASLGSDGRPTETVETSSQQSWQHEDGKKRNGSFLLLSSSSSQYPEGKFGKDSLVLQQRRVAFDEQEEVVSVDKKKGPAAFAFVQDEDLGQKGASRFPFDRFGSSFVGEGRGGSCVLAQNPRAAPVQSRKPPRKRVSGGERDITDYFSVRKPQKPVERPQQSSDLSLKPRTHQKSGGENGGKGAEEEGLGAANARGGCDESSLPGGCEGGASLGSGVAGGLEVRKGDENEGKSSSRAPGDCDKERVSTTGESLNDEEVASRRTHLPEDSSSLKLSMAASEASSKSLISSGLSAAISDNCTKSFAAATDVCVATSSSSLVSKKMLEKPRKQTNATRLDSPRAFEDHPFVADDVSSPKMLPVSSKSSYRRSESSSSLDSSSDSFSSPGGSSSRSSSLSVCSSSNSHTACGLKSSENAAKFISGKAQRLDEGPSALPRGKPGGETISSSLADSEGGLQFTGGGGTILCTCTQAENEPFEEAREAKSCTHAESLGEGKHLSREKPALLNGEHHRRTHTWDRLESDCSLAGDWVEGGSPLSVCEGKKGNEGEDGGLSSYDDFKGVQTKHTHSNIPSLSSDSQEMLVSVLSSSHPPFIGKEDAKMEGNAKNPTFSASGGGDMCVKSAQMSGLTGFISPSREAWHADEGSSRRKLSDSLYEGEAGMQGSVLRAGEASSPKLSHSSQASSQASNAHTQPINGGIDCVRDDSTPMMGQKMLISSQREIDEEKEGKVKKTKKQRQNKQGNASLSLNFEEKEEQRRNEEEKLLRNAKDVSSSIASQSFTAKPLFLPDAEGKKVDAHTSFFAASHTLGDESSEMEAKSVIPPFSGASHERERGVSLYEERISYSLGNSVAPSFTSDLPELLKSRRLGAAEGIASHSLKDSQLFEGTRETLRTHRGVCDGYAYRMNGFAAPIQRGNGDDTTVCDSPPPRAFLPQTESNRLGREKDVQPESSSSPSIDGAGGVVRSAAVAANEGVMLAGVCEKQRPDIRSIEARDSGFEGGFDAQSCNDINEESKEVNCDGTEGYAQPLGVGERKEGILVAAQAHTQPPGPMSEGAGSYLVCRSSQPGGQDLHLGVCYGGEEKLQEELFSDSSSEGCEDENLSSFGGKSPSVQQEISGDLSASGRLTTISSNSESTHTSQLLWQNQEKTEKEGADKHPHSLAASVSWDSHQTMVGSRENSFFSEFSSTKKSLASRTREAESILQGSAYHSYRHNEGSSHCHDSCPTHTPLQADNSLNAIPQHPSKEGKLDPRSCHHPGGRLSPLSNTTPLLSPPTRTIPQPSQASPPTKIAGFSTLQAASSTKMGSRGCTTNSCNIGYGGPASDLSSSKPSLEQTDGFSTGKQAAYTGGNLSDTLNPPVTHSFLSSLPSLPSFSHPKSKLRNVWESAARNFDHLSLISRLDDNNIDYVFSAASASDKAAANQKYNLFMRCLDFTVKGSGMLRVALDEVSPHPAKNEEIERSILILGDILGLGILEYRVEVLRALKIIRPYLLQLILLYNLPDKMIEPLSSAMESQWECVYTCLKGISMLKKDIPSDIRPFLLESSDDEGSLADF